MSVFAGTGGSEGGADVGGAGEGAVGGSEDAGGSGTETSGGEGGDPAAPDGGGAPPRGCGDGMRCAPPVPEGWDGPFSTDLTNSVPDCPLEFPELAYEGGSAPADEPATCACQCENCTGGSCKQRVTFFSDAACQTSVGVFTPTPDACGLPPVGANSVRFDYAKDVSALTCDVTAGSTETVPPRWLDRVRLCGGNAKAGECAGAEVCVPALGEPEALCIVSDGKKSCPAGYPKRQLASSGFDDSRGCDCKCVEEAKCSSEIRPLLRSSCDETASTTGLSLDACVVINQSFYSTHVSTVTPAAAAKAVGNVTPVGTISICCAP
jgi:hypothetical protein